MHGTDLKTLTQRTLIAALLIFAGYSTGWARGASPYLPLNLSPRIERQIERVLILAGKPVMSRPIAAATVLDALPAACQRDRALCEEVESYLRLYTRSWSITSVKPEVAATSGDSEVPIPNRHGQSVDTAWQIKRQWSRAARRLCCPEPRWHC